MNSREAGWKTYLRSALFLGPGLLAWALMAVFVFPKLQQIWVDAESVNRGILEFQWMMTGLHFAMHNMTMILGLVVAVLVASEFTGEVWRRYRRAVVGGLVFVFNSAIIFGLVTACLVASIAAPALANR